MPQAGLMSCWTNLKGQCVEVGFFQESPGEIQISGLIDFMTCTFKVVFVGELLQH